MSKKNVGSLLEKKRHGTVDFPCAIYQSSGEDEQFFVKHHWHNNIEVLHLKQGSYYVDINMESCEVCEEMLVFINPQEVHRLHVTAGPYQESAVVFDMDILKNHNDDPVFQSLLEPIQTGKREIQRYVPVNSEAGRLLKVEYERIIDAFSGQKAPTFSGMLKVRAALFNMFCILEEQALLFDREQDADYRIEYIRTILDYIKENYSQKIKIGDIAAQVGMNEQYFCRFFKKMLGSTPVEYLNEYRIARVKQSLISSDDSIMSIAMDCGFSHMGNFIQMFKKTEGCTPSDYRKIYKKSK